MMEEYAEELSKQWMFQESIRLETQKKELDELYLKFLEEKKQFQEEMKLLNHKVLAERKRLKEEAMFFDKKMAILKNGFEQLDLDRKRLEKEKIRFEAECERERDYMGQYSTDSDLTRCFFKGVRNQLTLKKRYKDLIKIFHPDNVCGDTDTIQLINKEYERLREEFAHFREA